MSEQHAAEILRLPILALQDYIERELLENPVLELKGEGDDDGTPADENSDGGEPIAEDLTEANDPEPELVIDKEGDERDFFAENIPYVTPDILVERNEDDEYEVKLVDDWTPNIYISRRYIDLYRDKGADPKAKEFLKRKIQSAQWLIEAIEQRRNTLMKVTRAIIQHQRAFLDKGPEHIEPLKMQQIADQVGVHVTTVSRAVDDKWVQTPRGIFPLKRFFGGGTDTGEKVA